MGIRKLTLGGWWVLGPVSRSGVSHSKAGVFEATPSPEPSTLGRVLLASLHRPAVPREEPSPIGNPGKSKLSSSTALSCPLCSICLPQACPQALPLASEAGGGVAGPQVGRASFSLQQAVSSKQALSGAGVTLSEAPAHWLPKDAQLRWGNRCVYQCPCETPHLGFPITYCLSQWQWGVRCDHILVCVSSFLWVRLEQQTCCHPGGGDVICGCSSWTSSTWMTSGDTQPGRASWSEAMRPSLVPKPSTVEYLPLVDILFNFARCYWIAFKTSKAIWRTFLQMILEMLWSQDIDVQYLLRAALILNISSLSFSFQGSFSSKL